MAKIDFKGVIEAANALRDVKNWLAVFQKEYDISNEAAKKLNKEFDALGKELAGITCDASGLRKESVRTVANELRDTKAWLAVFAREYDLHKEAVKVLNGGLDKFGDKLASIKCR